jgi:hypothetical protein
LLHIYI